MLCCLFLDIAAGRRLSGRIRLAAQTTARRRLTAAIETQWPLCAELLATDVAGVDSTLRNQFWHDSVSAAFAEATIAQPALPAVASDAVQRVTREAHAQRASLLAEMQSLARQHPDAVW